ncbi:hypothetical protein [Synechococcus phage Ssp-JY38]
MLKTTQTGDVISPGFRGVLGRALIDAEKSQAKPQGEAAELYRASCDRISALLDERLALRRQGDG